MPSYLKIENPGVCPFEAFTILGATSKGENSAQGTIGQFGSGCKHAIALLLRNNIQPIIFCGNLRLEFSTRKQEFSDDITSTEINRIVVKYSGKTEDGKSKTNTEELGFALEYGKYDWTTIGMGLREFVSNAIDMSIKWNCHTSKEVQYPWDGADVTVVCDEGQIRAKSGTTRIFIPLQADVFKFYENLGRWFLHFSDPDSLNKELLPKADRNFSDMKSAVIYRKGVLVREVKSDKPSIFDYNLQKLQLDECRKVDDYTVKGQAAQALADASARNLFTLFSHPNMAWEHTFDTYYLSPMYDTSEETKKARRKQWQAALAEFGENACVSLDTNRESVIKKGFAPIVLPENIVKGADAYGCLTSLKVLNEIEQSGIDILPPSDILLESLDWVWDRLEQFGELGGKEKPEIKYFRKNKDAGSVLFGFYDRSNDFIGINSEMDGNSFLLIQTILEECCHYITQSFDGSRDIQEWAFKLAVKGLKLL